MGQDCLSLLQIACRWAASSRRRGWSELAFVSCSFWFPGQVPKFGNDMMNHFSLKILGGNSMRLFRSNRLVAIFCLIGFSTILTAEGQAQTVAVDIEGQIESSCLSFISSRTAVKSAQGWWLTSGDNTESQWHQRLRKWWYGIRHKCTYSCRPGAGNQCDCPECVGNHLRVDNLDHPAKSVHFYHYGFSDGSQHFLSITALFGRHPSAPFRDHQPKVPRARSHLRATRAE